MLTEGEGGREREIYSRGTLASNSRGTLASNAGTNCALLQVVSVTGSCAATNQPYPPTTLPGGCQLLLEVRRAQGATAAGGHIAVANSSVLLLPCYVLNGPEPMCTEIHDTLCRQGFLSWQACAEGTQPDHVAGLAR
jgi:hypothetical protein